MNPLEKLAWNVSRKARLKRAKIFRDAFAITEQTRILDLGSETGANIANVLDGTPARPENVYIADINAEQVAEGARRFGFNAVEVDEARPLPFDDDFFDIVYCSSVIEHVTVPKADVWTVRSGREFREHSLRRQREFANEIKRLGKQYFVQTPYRHFPVESHSWLPVVAWLPRRVLIPVLRFSNLFWVKKTSPDWYLLNRREMSELFPDAQIVDEKSMGLAKSLIAIRRVA